MDETTLRRFENINIKNYKEFKCSGSEQAFKVSDRDVHYITSLNFSWYFWKNKKGECYVCTRVHNQTMYLHRIIMMKMGMKQPSPKHIVIHVNNDKLDNRRENLQWIHKNKCTR